MMRGELLEVGGDQYLFGLDRTDEKRERKKHLGSRLGNKDGYISSPAGHSRPTLVLSDKSAYSCSWVSSLENACQFFTVAIHSGLSSNLKYCRCTATLSKCYSKCRKGRWKKVMGCPIYAGSTPEPFDRRAPPTKSSTPRKCLVLPVVIIMLLWLSAPQRIEGPCTCSSEAGFNRAV